jgi:hypothetical protein
MSLSYDDLANKKDAIMLAMVSVALLISEKRHKSMRESFQDQCE